MNKSNELPKQPTSVFAQSTPESWLTRWAGASRKLLAKGALASLTLASATVVLAGPGGQCTLTDFNTALQSTGTPVFVGAPGATNGDDASAADNIVRTNDSYVYRFNYKIPSGKVENNITFSSTLPLTAGKKTVIWDGLPAQCDGAGSSVSADGLTLVCNIGGQDRQAEGDLVASVLAQVKATILGANADIINASTSVKTDDCAVGAVADAPAPPVTISARQKVDFRKDVLYTQQQGYSFSRTSGGPTEDGYLVAWYVYMDQFDPAGSSSKGGQAINSPVTFQDAAKNFPPGSIWFDCYRAQGEGQGNITCPPRYTPASVPVAAAPGAALTAPALQHPITITARPGEENEFLVAGGKNTDVNLNPNTSQPQRLATFAVRFWVPLSAIAEPLNQTSSGQIDLNNKIENFVGTTNGASPVALVDQRTTNNQLTNTVVATLPGSYYKYVARNWLGTVWNQSTYAGVNPGEYQLDGTNNWGDSGTALVYPNQVFFPRLDLYNPSAAATTSTLPFNINGPSAGIGSILCENFDNNQVELAILPGSGGHAAGWYYGAPSTIAFGASGNSNSTFPAGYKVEYGVANSGSGNPGRTSRCEDSDAQWFDTVTAADAVGKKDLLNKVRMKIPSLGGGQNTLFTIAQRTRPGLNGTYIIDYTPVKAANIRGAGGVLGAWFDSSYTSRACTTCPTVPGDNTGLSTGKRVQLTTSLARVSKQAYASLAALATNQPASQAIANKTVTYVLTPSLQSIVPGLPTTFVTVQDRLPAPLTYVSGSASIPPDSIQTDAGGTTLSWTLNNVTPNTTLTTISFVALIPVDIPPNSSVNNLVYIDSPDDSSPLAQRTGDKALTVISPPGINVTKSTNTPLIEPNNTMTFKLAIANIEIASTTLDIIDVLPYVGDSAAVTQAPLAAQAARNPSSAFAGTLFMNTGAVTVLSGGGASPVIRYSKQNPTVAGVGPTALLIDPSAPNNSTTVADGWCLVSEFGSNPNCPVNIGQATAFRVSNYVLAGNSVGALQVKAATNGNTVGDLYTNRFGIRSDNPGFNFLRSNDVPVRVVLGSISGKVYVDTDGSATQGAPGAEPSLPGVTVQLCATDPALTSGTCPAPVATTTTSPGGTYTFSNLISRPYWIVETKPAGYANGPTNATGSAGGAATPNNFSAINLPIGANASNYNFGHRLTDLVTTVKVPSAPVVPGSVVNATVTFGNVSQVASENTTATIKLNPGLTGVVVTPPPGWTLVSPYNATTGEITFAPSNPGATVTPGYSIDFPVSFNAPQTGTVTVTSRITNTIGDLTPINTPSSTDPKRNAHELPITVIPQRVDVRKAVGTPRNVSGAELLTLSIPATEDVWLIPYRVTVGVASGGNAITATNVQLVDDLRATFPQVGATPITIDRILQTSPGTLLGTEATGAIASAAPAINAPSCGIANAAYNGTSTFTMLPAGVTLAPGQSCTVEFAVLLRYLTPAQTPVVAQLNTAVGYSSLSPVPAPTFPTPGSPTFATQPDSVDKSTDRPETPPNTTPGVFPPVPGTTGTPNGDTPDPTPVQLKPQVLDVRKSSSAMTQTDLSGKKFRTFYTVNAKNNGTSVLTNFQLSENLRFTFPAPAVYTVTNIVEVNPASGGTPSCIALNGNFDGGYRFSTTDITSRNYNLIGTGGGGGISTQPLAAGAECVISFQVDIDYLTSNPPSAAPQNRIFGSTAAGGSNDGPPFEQATGLKAGDNPQLISKDTSTNFQPATPIFGVAPADPGPPTAPKNDLGSGSLTPLGTLEVVKSTTGPAVALSDRKYRVPYEMTVVARGSASFVLPNVQAIDNLAQAFQGGPTITVLPAASQTVVAIGGANCPANITTVASPNLTFFPGNTSLTVGQGCTFRFFVEVEYANPAAVVTTIQYNQVYATSIAGAAPNPGGVITLVAGTSTSPFGAAGGSVAGSFAPPAGVLIAHDASTNGNTLPTSPAGDRPLPTPVQFPAPPTIDAVKFARNITRPGAPITTGDTVEWTVIYKNSGTTVANNVQVTDVRQAGYSSSFVVSAARIPENTIELIQPNAGYNGTSDINLLFTTPVTPVNLAPGDQLVFKINSVVSSTSAAVTNQAILTANELGGPGGTKVLTSAVDKGITQVCPSGNTCLPVGVTLPTDTITSTTATPGTKGQPNSLPIVPSAPITGKVFLDRDTNATFGAGDTTPLGTVTITLCRVNAPICPASEIQGTTTTNPTSGNYTFTTVPPGNYFLIETQPAGYGSSTPNSRPVTMAGVAITDQDFGETAASVSGRVYQDNDASGTFGGSDTGIGGITVELCLSGDTTCTNPVRTTTTSPTSGTYTFADLPAPPVGQTYYIKEGVIPATLTNATTTVGSLAASPGTAVTPGTADSPTSRINGITWTPSATPATTPTAVGINYNFGEAPLSSISGSVILDADRSGGQTGAETGIPNVTTTLTLCRTNNNPCSVADTVSTTTSAPLTGSYTFANVTPGTYFVIETQPPGYASSSVNSLPVTLTATSIVGQNFFETAADISGTVYNDNNASGVFDAGDTPISGATMRLCLTSQSAAQCASNPKATATTLPTGSYTFANVPAPPTGDSYVIVEDESVAPLTLVANGTATVGALTGGTSQVNGSIVATEQVPTFTGNSTINAISFVMPTAVAAGVPVVGLGYNFGELPVAGISGKVFLDKDFTNGTTGTNNPATDTPLLNNATTTVTLCSADPGPSGVCPPASVVATTVTAANGDYSFPNVPAGNFWVVETQPAGYGSSSPNVQPVVRADATAVTNVNFADTLAEIKGRVYQDNNASGTSDAPDVGIGGVIVQLCLSSDTACATPVQSTTTTPTSGTYTFANVPAPPAGQTYFIKEGVIPASLQNGTTTVGNLAVSGAAAAPVGAANSPASTINNITWTPTVALFNGLAAAGTDYNFGELPVTTISGSVILDRNFDGLPNGTDSGLPVTTTLTLCRTNSNPCVGSDIVSTTTSSPTNGSYSFANVTPGNYFVIQTQPAGYASTSPNGLPANAIGTTPITGVNFLESGAQLSGTVYKDVNYNGAYNPTGALPDMPLAGVAVQLCSTSNCAPGSVIATSTTTAAGLYEFKDLPAPPAGQQYFILENQSTVPPTPTVLSDGTTNVGTFTTQGGSTAVPGTPVQTPSRVDGITWTPATSVVNGTASVVGTNFNFGEIEGLDISGRVFYDKDRNGASNEPAGNGINAVTITLCRSATVLCPSSDVVGTTTTAVDGNYNFTRIPPGAYFVQESQPAGYGSTPTTAAPTATDVRPITLTNVNLASVDFADTLSSLGGLVYLDRNGNQSRDAATEETRPGVTVTLTGIDASGASVTRTAVTNASGTYQFDDLKAGTYSVAETQDPAFGNGAAHAGSTGGTGAPNSNVISAIALPVATDSVNNNFGDVPKSGGVSGSLWRDNDHDRIKDPGEPAMPGWTVQLFRETVAGSTPTLVASAVSDANGAYSITGQEVGPGYSVRFLAPNGTVFSGAVNGEQGPGSAQANGGTTTTGGLRGINLQENTVIPFQSLPVDPAGVVYDSDTRLPVAGATVRFGPIGSCAAYDPAIHLFGGAANATQVTVGEPPASAGFYQFLLLDNDPLRPLPANCVYGVTVTPPAGFVADPAIPSLGTLPAQPKPPNEAFLIAPNSGAPQAGQPTTWYQAFNLGPNSRDIVNNHIPLVSNNRPVLFISKVAGKTSVELGDNVKYTVKVRYVSGTASLPVIRVVDSMPAGFKLIPGTSFVSVPTGAAVAAVPAGNIAGAPGAVVTYNIPLPGGVFNVGQELELTYRVRVGVGSLQGDGINRAQANSVGVVRSNIAQAKVKVNPGVFTSEACIVGKIYTDCNNNHTQDAEEVGVPGVRLYLQDGTYMVSDSEGKYSLCGLEPTSHVLKVDQLTLPRGSRLTTTSNRNLGNADSLWLDLKNGEMQQADFAIGSCSNTVLEQVKARRAQGGVRSVDNESKGGAALKFEGKNPNYPDQGTDSANQPLVKPRPPQSPGAPPPGEAENNIPVPQLPAATSNTPGNNIRLTK